MITGERAFDGTSAASVMAAVLERDPPAMAIRQPLVSTALDHVVRRCLAKDADDRWQTAGDVMRELKWIAESANGQPSHVSSTGRSDDQSSGPWIRRQVLAWVAASAAVGAGLLLVGGRWAGLWTARDTSAPVPVRFAIVAPPAPRPVIVRRARQIAISRDGQLVAYTTGGGELGNNRLALRRVNRLDVELLRGATNADSPFFSPDGKWIGFFDATTSELRKISIAGGTSIRLARADANARTASWGSDDTVIFATSAGLMSVAARGGEPRMLAKGSGYQYPALLPGGRAILFSSQAIEGVEGPHVAVLDPETGTRKPLLPGSNGVYSESGHLLYTSDSKLFAVAFDPDHLEVSGDPVAVADDIAIPVTGEAQFSLSRTGTLTYVSASAGDYDYTDRARTLVWVDRAGHEAPVQAERKGYHALRLSPDGTKVALDVRGTRTDEFRTPGAFGEEDTWTFDFSRQTLTRLTDTPEHDDAFPVWTRDGRRIVTGGGGGLFWRPADGSGAAERLTTSKASLFPMSFSLDGTMLIVTMRGTSNNDLASVSMDGRGQVTPLVPLQTRFTEGPAEISWGGKWLAYQSNEAGNEIYVRPYPELTRERWKISGPGGGRHPAWSRDDRELFYLDEAGALVVVAIQTAPGFKAGPPRKLFNGRYFSAGQGRSYDVSSDGTRFLFIKGTRAAGASIIVNTHWVEELKRRVPLR